MKKLIFALSALITFVSCEVENPYDAPTMNKTNISTFCERVFKDNIQGSIESFCTIYYISRFLEASPEEKVSAKYDDIRTTLRKNSDSYSFGNMSITFSHDSPFTVGSRWSVKHGYRRKESMTMRSENEWKIENEDGTSSAATIIVTVLSADDSGMKLNVQVKGEWEEKSSYSSKYSSSSIDVEIVNKTPIGISTSSYAGVMEFDFYEKHSIILQCDMTLRAGATSLYDIH